MVNIPRFDSHIASHIELWLVLRERDDIVRRFDTQLTSYVTGYHWRLRRITPLIVGTPPGLPVCYADNVVTNTMAPRSLQRNGLRPQAMARQ